MRYANLASPNFQSRLDYSNALNKDIISAIEKNFPTGVQQTRQFAKQFIGSSYRDTAENIWNFLKQNMTYVKDQDHEQLIKLPSRFIHDGGYSDCKSFSLAAASLLASAGLPNVRFRYANYMSGKIPTHVYTVASDENGRDIIVDAVWEEFGTEKKPQYKFDHAMNVRTLSGIGLTSQGNVVLWSQAMQALANEIPNLKTEAQAQTFVNTLQSRIDALYTKYNVSKGTALDNVGDALKKAAQAAWDELKKIGLAIPRQAYKGLVILNVHGLATDLMAAINKDPNSVKSKWESLGGDFDSLKSTAVTGAKKSAIFGLEETVNGIGSHRQEFLNTLNDADQERKAKILERVNRRYLQLNKYGIKGPIGIRAAAEDGIGVVFAAGLAVAAPILAAMASVLKALGLGGPKTDENGNPIPNTGIDNTLNTATQALTAFGKDPSKTMIDPTKNPGQFNPEKGKNDTPNTSGFSLSSTGVWVALGAGALLLFGIKKK